MRFASFLSGGSTTMGVTTNKSTGKETGKMHLCAVGGQTIAALNYTILRALTCAVVQLIFLTNESS